MPAPILNFLNPGKFVDYNDLVSVPGFSRGKGSKKYGIKRKGLVGGEEDGNLLGYVMNPNFNQWVDLSPSKPRSKGRSVCGRS
jgi:hypothetical protein